MTRPVIKQTRGGELFIKALQELLHVAPEVALRVAVRQLEHQRHVDAPRRFGGPQDGGLALRKRVGGAVPVLVRTADRSHIALLRLLKRLL